MPSSLRLRKANKRASQGTIQVRRNQRTQRSKTAEVSSEKLPERHEGLLHYSTAVVIVYVALSVRSNGGKNWGFTATEKWSSGVSAAVISSKRMQFYIKFLRSFGRCFFFLVVFFFKQYLNSQILSDSCLCSWAGIAQLPLHHYCVDWDPRCCSLTQPQATTQLSEPGECT